ncbi:MAG: patatin-like phospholipase family protein [Cyclobacteriaceae bacterium]
MEIGLVLSGGGIRGMAHLGVIKALEEKGIRFSQVSGVSAGSIIGAFYCQGYTPDEILAIIEKTSLYKVVRPAISWRGLLKLDKVMNEFKSFFEEDSFASLKIPLHISATDVTNGTVRYFNEGPLFRAILASSSIPIVFDPVMIDETYYIDGGILNNLPVEPVKDICDRIIGIHTNPVGITNGAINMKMLMERSLLLAINCNIEARKGLCDLFIEPTGLDKFGVFDIKKAKDIFEIGYNFTHKLFEDDASLEELFKT